MQKNDLLLGAHMSISGGLEKSLYRGASIGCNAIQIFTHSNRQWHMKPIAETERNNFFEAIQETNIKSIFVHASYLINLASNNHETLKLSISTLEQELIRCDFLDIKYLILHPGSGDKNENKALNQIAEHINNILEKNSSKAIILLENMAGQGSSTAHTFEQLSLIRSKIKNFKRIGYCFDTCHAWAAGYDFSTPEKYLEMWKQFDSILGIENLKAIHINDSKKECGSFVDRHENIGKGKIGVEAFNLLMNDKKLIKIPKILETPDKELEGYKANLETLLNLFNN